MSKMQIEYIDINKLKMSKYNPRKMSDDDKRHLKQSLKEFGCQDPLLVNKKNFVIGGHQRLDILKELGYKTVPIVRVDLPEKKEKALNVALNKISGDWDDEKLTDLLNSIDTNLLSATGFSKPEIERLNENYDFTSLTKQIDNLQAEEEGLLPWSAIVDKKVFSKHIEPVMKKIKKSKKMQCFTSEETNGLILKELCKVYQKNS